MEKETKFVDGLYFNPKRETAPDFVRGSISINKLQFTAWLAQQEPSEKGYVNIDMLLSKQDKIYFKLNDWKPKKDYQAEQDASIDSQKNEKYPSNEIDASEIPF